MSDHDPSCGCREYRGLTRRSFLGYSGGALAAASVPAWLPRVALGAGASGRDVLVNVFLRGGADALTLCVPFGESSYYQMRPRLAVPRPDSGTSGRALDLDGFFGLPPALGKLLPFWQDSRLAIVHATGLTSATRSHFSAMYFMESGQPDPPSTLFGGWLGRHLSAVGATVPGTPMRGLGFGYGLARTLAGGPSTVPVRDPVYAGFAGDPSSLADRRWALSGMYVDAEATLRLGAETTLRTVDLLTRIDLQGYRPAGGAVYPEDDFGNALRATAALIKAGVGLEAAAIDVGGWDTHEQQGPLDGTMSMVMTSLGDGLAAFQTDMTASASDNVLVVVQSEFGRNAWENASAGTDHGHGGAMLLLGKAVKGKKVFTQWPGLAPEQLYEGQDLAVTIDYRDILSEVVTKRLGNPDVRTVFPDPSYQPTIRGVLR